MSLNTTNGVSSNTIVTAFGTATIFYTSSVSESIRLFVKSQNTLSEPISDLTLVGFTGGGALSGVVTGSVSYPFSLVGNAYLDNGDYTIYVSASSTNVQFDVSRPARFRVDSETTNLSAV